MQLNFTKVLFLGFSRKATSGTAKFSAALPVGKLSSTQIALDPKQSELVKHALILDAQSVDSFEIVRTEAKGKKAKKTKAFKIGLLVHFTDPQGAKKLEQYMLTCKEPEQDNLPGTEEDAEETGWW